jgi:hypothetical protein
MTAMPIIMAVVVIAVMVPSRAVISVGVARIATVIVVAINGSISVSVIRITIIVTVMVAIDPAQYQGRRDARPDAPAPSMVCLRTIG